MLAYAAGRAMEGLLAGVRPADALTSRARFGLCVLITVHFLGQGNKGGSSRLPLGEERANILLLACCYEEGRSRILPGFHDFKIS